MTAHRWLWQSFTDGLICGAPPPPSPPHRWFSPPPMFQTGGPSLNPSQLPPRMAFIHHRKLAKLGSHTYTVGLGGAYLSIKGEELRRLTANGLTAMRFCCASFQTPQTSELLISWIIHESTTPVPPGEAFRTRQSPPEDVR